MAAGPASRLGFQSPGIKQGCGSNHTLHLAPCTNDQPVNGCTTSSLSRLDVRPAHHGLEYPPKAPVVEHPYRHEWQRWKLCT